MTARETKHLPLQLGLRANLAQFSLLVAVNALVGGMLGQERVVHPRHVRIAMEPLGDGQRVAAVRTDAERQRLEPLQEEEGVERRQRRADRR